MISTALMSGSPVEMEVTPHSRDAERYPSCADTFVHACASVGTVLQGVSHQRSPSPIRLLFACQILYL